MGRKPNREAEKGFRVSKMQGKVDRFHRYNTKEPNYSISGNHVYTMCMFIPDLTLSQQTKLICQTFFKPENSSSRLRPWVCSFRKAAPFSGGFKEAKSKTHAK